MTRRSSVRAQARRNYRDLAAKAAPQKAPPNPNPSPQKASAGGESKETELTKRVRALYEDSAVPVAQIAAAAGVTERTIYKYAARHGWKPRYRWAPRGKAAPASNRERRGRLSPDFAPVKGAGARFIRRDDEDKPVAVGLKATDPAGAALAEAEEERMMEEQHCMLQFLNTQLAALERYLAEPGSQPLGSAAPDAMRDLYMRNLMWACDVLEDLREARAKRG